MTLNSRTPKFPLVYESDLKQLGRVGPGSYQKQKSDIILSNNGSQHVFNSKIQRNLNFNQGDNTQLGPGHYDTEKIYPKFIIKKKINDCKSSFVSKLQRFPTNLNKQQRNQSQEQLNIYEFLIDQNAYQKKNGKLFGITRDHKMINKSIPSIPSASQSYGYRVDQKTNKLVQNENPNILLARKTFLNGINRKIFDTTQNIFHGPGSYFPKSGLNKNIIGLKWYKNNDKNQNTKQKTPNKAIYFQLKQQQIISLEQDKKKWLEKGNILIGKQNRFAQSYSDKKKELILNSIRKKYGDFISDCNQDLQSAIQKSRIFKLKLHEIDKNKVKHKDNKIQCFLSKQNRQRHNNKQTGNKASQNNQNNYSYISNVNDSIKLTSKESGKNLIINNKACPSNNKIDKSYIQQTKVSIELKQQQQFDKSRI